ncbi:LYR motif containing protein 1 isoform X2 [Rhincodon typus]|nr:LYR motif containing protein 1 isoform X2 [Rhincodon typus]
MTLATRCDVLGLYRRIFRIARTWQSLSGLSEDTMKERDYIITEARTLFKKNKNLTDAEAIKICIQECQTRIEMGLHYRIPYPRPMLHLTTISRKYLDKLKSVDAWHNGSSCFPFHPRNSIPQGNRRKIHLSCLCQLEHNILEGTPINQLKTLKSTVVIDKFK